MASDLEEVQNVVDVSFGDMSDEVEKFANSAVQNFGMSALTAKRMASTFMSMANGMGLAAKDGKNMSLQLTALAGDMASFYNVEQDVAQTALNSIFTGETESLKKFGIVLTEANLNAFALSRGITKSYNAMSQAEKVALRYQYVLKATANAQGDFARTSGSWANQVRILKEQWSQLLGILGKGLIAILTPLIQALNKLLSYLIAIGNAIASLFGGKKITGVSKGLDSAAGGAGSLDDNLGSAGDKLDGDNKKAEKLAKTLASFDELDILTSKDEDKDSGGSSGGDTGGGGGGFEIPDYNTDELPSKTDEMLEKLKEAFEKFKPILDAFIEGFNFDRIIERYKELVQTAQTKMNEFAQTLDFSRYQPALEGFAYSLGELLGTLIYNTVDTIGIVVGDLFDAFAPAMTEFINNTIPRWIEIVDQVLQTLTVLANEIKYTFDDIWQSITPFFDLFGQILTEIQQKLDVFWNEHGKVIFDKLREAIQNLGEAIRNFWETIADPIIQKIAEKLKEIWDEHLSETFDKLLNIIGLFVELLLDLWNNVLMPLYNWLIDTFGPGIAERGESLIDKIGNLIEYFIDRVNNVLGVLEGLLTFIKGVFTGDWELAWSGIKEIFANTIGAFPDIMKPIINSLIGMVNRWISAACSGVNLVVRAINSISFDIPDWIPGIGGKHVGFNLSEITAPQIPTLAKGGVLTSPTLAMVGEYAGASNNPEIVTPQSILKETIDASNGEVVSALYQMAQLVIAAINDVDINVSIGDDVIAQSAKRGNDDYRNRTGKPLLA